MSIKMERAVECDLCEELESDSDFIPGQVERKELTTEMNSPCAYDRDDASSDSAYLRNTYDSTGGVVAHIDSHQSNGDFSNDAYTKQGNNPPTAVEETDFMHIDLGTMKVEWPKTEPPDPPQYDSVFESPSASKQSREISPDQSWDIKRVIRPRKVFFEEFSSHQSIETDSLFSRNTSTERFLCESPLPELSAFFSESLLPKQLPPLSPPAGEEFPESYMPGDGDFKYPFFGPNASEVLQRDKQRYHAPETDGVGSQSQVTGAPNSSSRCDNFDNEYDKEFEKSEDMEFILKNYQKGGINTNDGYIYCDLCNRKWKGSCSIHGSYAHIRDARTPMNTADRAERTTPKGLIVSTSGIKGANNGVWSCQEVPARSVYGPYKGVIIPFNGEPGEYSWQVLKDGKTSHYIDASDTKQSNWMRYINCARNVFEQNLEAFQYRGKIYYRTTRRIQPNEELLVWYGYHFGKKLGILWEDFVQSRPVTCVQSGLLKPGRLSEEEQLDKTDDIPLLSRITPTYQRSSVCMKVSSGDKPITCGICGARFRQRGTLVEAHMKTHDGVKHNCCTKCGQWFSHEISLKIHSNKIHGKIAKKPAKRVKNERHMSTDDESNPISEDRPFTCSECKSSFYSKTSLERHIARRRANIWNGSNNESLISKDVPPERQNVCKKNVLQKNIGVFPPKRRQSMAVRSSKTEHCMLKNVRQNLLQDVKPIPALEIRGETNAGSSTGTGRTRPTADTQIFQEAEEVLKTFKNKTVIEKTPDRVRTRSKAISGICPSGKKKSVRTLLCEICGALFWRKVTLQTHLQIRHNIPVKQQTLYVKDGPKRFKCKLCGVQYREKSTLELHLRVHQNDTSENEESDKSNDKPFECEECGSSFKAEMTLKYHIKIHKESSEPSGKTTPRAVGRPFKKPFKCLECGTRYRALCTLNAHMKVHDEEYTALTGKSYLSCQECKLLFNTISAYEAHQRGHNRPSLTSLSGRDVSGRGSSSESKDKVKKTKSKNAFPTRKTLSPPDSQKRVGKKGLFWCKQCSAKFSDRVSLANHSRSHIRTIASEDEQCVEFTLSDAETSEKESKLPRLPRQDDKSIQMFNLLDCDTCNCQFYSSSALAVHKKSHTLAHTYKCLACGLSFKERTSLDVHVREHIREKQFFCDLSDVRIPDSMVR